jgi:hypothetical protein
MDLRTYEQTQKEFHLPGYNFCGPGTKVYTRLLNGDTGINELDNACKVHDIEYLMYAGNDEKLQQSDETLRRKAKKIGGFYADLIENAFSLKKIGELLGIISPNLFAMQKNDQIPAYMKNQIGRLLYNKFVYNYYQPNK